MLYSIIPPTIVVLSLMGIILFLVKKAPEIARLAEFQEKADSTKTKRDYYTNSEKTIEKKKIVTIIGLFLIKKARQLKIFFQENKRFVVDWRKQLKIKKAQKEELTERKGFEQLENKEGDTLIDVHNEEYLNKLIEENSELQKEEVTNPAKIVRKREIKKVIKPIVSKKVVMPKKTGEKKDLFEKLLIDRIAANPKDIEAYERLGEYYSEIENWEYAKECFKQVIKLDNKNISVKIKMKKLERLLSK